MRGGRFFREGISNIVRPQKCIGAYSTRVAMSSPRGGVAGREGVPGGVI